MVFINEIEPEYSYSIWEEAIDSGYSDVSGQSSPCPLSPPPSPQQHSENLSFIYYPVVPCIVFPLPVFQPSNEVAISLVPKSVDQIEFEPCCSSSGSYPPSISRLIKWSLPPPTVPYFEIPGWEPMPYGMEQFWQSAFAWFFRPFWVSSNHIWTLQPVSSPPVDDEWPWHSVSYSAKVRFQCQYKHGWTSMKGRVMFWFRMRRHNNCIISEVLFKLYGQQCNRCYKARNQDYLSPLWYHEEIENAMRFLVTEVAKTYYGGEKLPVPRRVRQGNPSKDNHHDPTRCQACVEGLCVVRF